MDEDLKPLVHPVMREWIPKLNGFITQVEQLGLDAIPALWDRESMWEFPLNYHASGLWTFPLLSEEGCQFFLTLAQAAEGDFKVNPDEDAPYQMPELILKDRAPGAHAVARIVWDYVIKPMCLACYGKEPDHCTAIQLCRYTPDTIDGGNWHHDECSEFTVLVNIAPELYEGGEFKVFLDGPLNKPFTLKDVPKGHAILFNGRMNFHKGGVVTEGEKNLLVYWCVERNSSKKWWN